jgi:translation initiation factor IF-1
VAVVNTAAHATVTKRFAFAEARGIPSLFLFYCALFYWFDRARSLGGPVEIKECLKEESIEIEGLVTTVLPGTMFRVELDNKHLVLATICGKMRKRFVRIMPGDRVRMEMSPYDLDKARITWRLK